MNTIKQGIIKDMVERRVTPLVFNKRVRYEYQIDQTYTAGIVLSGAEVKSLRLKQASLAGSYVQILRDGTAVLINATITPYKFSSFDPDYDPQKTRKLLLRKKEIYHLAEKASQKGWSLVPIEFQLQGAKIKLIIGLGRGKKNFEKREVIKKRDLEREMKREEKY